MDNDSDRFSDNSSAPDEYVKDVKEGEEVKVTSDGGIVKKCLTEGEGFDRPPKNSKVTVHYVGTLASDGSKFDSSRDRGEPFTFTLGKGEVIKGWDLGVATMRKGEKSILTCTADYAYGATGSPPKIPGGATLNFEVELLYWDDTTDVSDKRDRSVLKKVLKAGEKWDTPEYESNVTVDVVGKLQDGKEFLNKKGWQIVIGDEMVPPGLEQAIRSMKEKEECQVTVLPHNCYGDAGNDELGVPSGATCVFEIKMIEFDRPKSIYSIKEAKEKVDEAAKRKDQGNELYKAKKMERAIKKYKKAIEYVDDEYSLDDDGKKEVRAFKAVCLSNLAAVLLTTGDYAECVRQCDKALEIDAKNPKVLLRRAKANNALDNWKECQSDLEVVLGIDGENADAKKEMAKVKAKIKAQNDKDKKAFGNLFSKLQKMEEKEKKAE